MDIFSLMTETTPESIIKNTLLKKFLKKKDTAQQSSFSPFLGKIIKSSAPAFLCKPVNQNRIRLNKNKKVPVTISKVLSICT